MQAQARVILLVGPKGAGKTTLGRMLARKTGVHFLEVEVIAKRVLASLGGVINEDYAKLAFEEIVREVEAISGAHRVIVIETTGASERTASFIEALRRIHHVHLVRVHARAESCARRIAERDSSRQVDVPAELIREMQERTLQLQLQWDLEVDNDPPLAVDQVLLAFEPVLRVAP